MAYVVLVICTHEGSQNYLKRQHFVLSYSWSLTITVNYNACIKYILKETTHVVKGHVKEII